MSNDKSVTQCTQVHLTQLSGTWARAREALWEKLTTRLTTQIPAMRSPATTGRRLSTRGRMCTKAQVAEP